MKNDDLKDGDRIRFSVTGESEMFANKMNMFEGTIKSLRNNMLNIDLDKSNFDSQYDGMIARIEDVIIHKKSRRF